MAGDPVGGSSPSFRVWPSSNLGSPHPIEAARRQEEDRRRPCPPNLERKLFISESTEKNIRKLPCHWQGACRREGSRELIKMLSARISTQIAQHGACVQISEWGGGGMGMEGVSPLKRKLHVMRRHPWLFLQTGRPVIWRRRARWFDLEKVEEGRYRRRRRRAGAAVRMGLISRACRRMRSADSERRRRLQQWRYVSLQI